ncbi:MAG: hypothetical protein WKI04_04845 [Ferruginibacter sp.]
MKKMITFWLFYFILIQTFGQTNKKVKTYVLTQYNKTIYDRTLGNNPWGIGIGMQTFFINNTSFHPTIELTADVYLEDDKVFRMNPDNSPIKDVPVMINLFVGTSFNPGKKFYLSFVAGPSFINGQPLLGIKPSFGFNFSKNQQWTAKFSYINVFNRDKLTKEDFGSISIAVGRRLF